MSRRLALAILLLLPAAAFGQQYINPPPTSVQTTNCSGSIAAANTPQSLFTATQFKRGFWIEIGPGDSNTDSLYFCEAGVCNGTTTPAPNDGVSAAIGPGTATAPGSSFFSSSNYPVGVNYFIAGATIGDKFRCRVW